MSFSLNRQKKTRRERR